MTGAKWHKGVQNIAALLHSFELVTRTFNKFNYTFENLSIYAFKNSEKPFISEYSINNETQNDDDKKFKNTFFFKIVEYKIKTISP